MQLIVTDDCVSVSHSRKPYKELDEPIEVLCGMWTYSGSGNHVLDMGQDPTGEEAVFRASSSPLQIIGNIQHAVDICNFIW